MATSTIVKLATNIPVKVEARYVDIVPGKYGPQVRIKGQFDGEDGVLYAPGKVWAALKSLKRAGVIADQDYNEDPAEGESVNVPITAASFTLTNMQNPGDKYPSLTAHVAGQAPTPTTTNGKVAVSIGKTGIPELDEQEAVETEAVKGIQNGQEQVNRLDKLFHLYDACMGHAVAVSERLDKRGIPTDGQATAAICATLFIAAKDRGLA